MTGYRGYIASRAVRKVDWPQHIQNLTIRDYASRNNLHFLLSATEYKMDSCFMMLNSLLADLIEVEGIIMFSAFMLPMDTEKQNAIFTGCLTNKKELHFALENCSISSPEDVENVKDIIKISNLTDDVNFSF